MAKLIDSLPGTMLLSLKRESFYNVLPINLESKQDQNTNWEEDLFDNIPTIGAVVLIDKLINDVKLCELTVLDELTASTWGEATGFLAN
jgi:hypothetical protein